jgi:dsRNA-specific ribonuclease
MAEDNPIIPGIRGKDFASLIINLLKKGKLKPDYIKKILTDGGLEEYEKIFTSKKADENNNYEFYEFLGDLIANTTILWWMARRFPQLRKASAVRILARMKITYGSKKVFSVISEKQLGFWPYITARKDEKETQKKSLLEDVLEAFLGLTNDLVDTRVYMGAGYAICYNIISSLLDENMALPRENQFVDIAIDPAVLEDAITDVKQNIEDYFRPGKLSYVCDERKEDDVLTTCHLMIERDGKQTEIVEAKGSKASTAKENVAREAIKIFNKIGFKKNIPEIYRQVNDLKSNPISLSCIFRQVEIRYVPQSCFVIKLENELNSEKSCLGIITPETVNSSSVSYKPISSLILFLHDPSSVLLRHFNIKGVIMLNDCVLPPLAQPELEVKNTKDFTYNKMFQQNLLKFLKTFPGDNQELTKFKHLLKTSLTNID